MIDAERKNALMERFEAAYYSVTPGQGPASPEFPAFVLAKLLMKKGVITDEEYLEAIASEAEEEQAAVTEPAAGSIPVAQVTSVTTNEVAEKNKQIQI